MSWRLPRWLGGKRAQEAETVEGVEPVDIRRLVSPLRYDVVVRRGFFELLEANLGLYERDFDGFVRLAEESAYGVWFERVFCWRFGRALVQNPGERSAAFRDRVRRSGELYLGVQRHGWQTATKITLRSGKEIRSADSGKRVADTIFVGDGCHRLALLLLRGEPWLTPERYRVKVLPSYAPLDNTRLLLPGLHLSEAEYAAFLSWRYGRREHWEIESLLQEARAIDPKRLPELKAVIEADLPLLRYGGGASEEPV